MVLTRLSFDEPWAFQSDVEAVEYPFGILVANWSGYALERDLLVLSPFVLPGTTSTGKPLLPGRSGAVRFWFSPSWSSADLGGHGPGHPARLLELAAMDGVSIGFKWSLQVAENGDSVYLVEAGPSGMQVVLSATIQWDAGRWYLVTLNLTESETQLHVNRTLLAQGPALSGMDPSGTGLILGSDFQAGNPAGGLFDELTTFSGPLGTNQLAAYYQSLAETATLGPAADQDRASMVEAARTARAHAALTPLAAPAYTGGHAFGTTVLGECEANLIMENLTNSVRLTVTNATAGIEFDLFRTLDLFGDFITSSWWHWVAKATNGQVFTLSNGPCSHVFFVLGCTNDSDADGLTDAFELLVNKTSPLTNHSVNALYTDLQMVNVLVNSPDHDCGNEQNTQFESTCAVLGSNVIVAFVDSNKGVYNLGREQIDYGGYLTSRFPRMVGYALSTNGGRSFQDFDVPPLSRSAGPTNEMGDAGDPWLAVDTGSNWVYLVGTSPRNAGNYGIPLWKSTDGGITFSNPTSVLNGVHESDKPVVAVDSWPGIGQHDVYVACKGYTTNQNVHGFYLTVSTDGSGGTWTNSPVAVREWDGTSIRAANCPIVQVGPDHKTHVFWFERTGDGTNWLKLRCLSDRGLHAGDVQTICALRSTNSVNGNLELKRNNSAEDSDTFNAWPFPVPAVNPARSNHLYVAFADRGTNGTDKSDVYLTHSVDGGTNWTVPFPVNTVWTNDQWMPVLAVKPDGTQIFMAWYDRRNDTNNGLMEVFGRWGTVETNGSVNLGDEFRITSSSFPHVFSGIDTNNFSIGRYDPVYPPCYEPETNGVNLHWWYTEWPEDPLVFALGTFKHHVGEYNGIAADGSGIFFSWTDNRVPFRRERTRPQSDIRVCRLPWP